MSRTIGFVNVTTGRTGAAGVPRVNQEYGNACTFRFVGHESTKLEERPTMQSCPLRATNRNPLPNAPQVFQGNRSICVFRFGNQLFADAVIDVFGKTAFFSRQPLEFAFGRPCTFGLQFSPQAAVTVAHMVDMAGRVDFSITIYGDVHYTQVNPQCIFHIEQVSVRLPHR